MRNMLVKGTSNLGDSSIKKLRRRLNKPNKVPVTRVDGQPLTPNVPAYAVLHKNLSKAARKFTLEDGRTFLLGDFGEAFSPATERRPGRDSRTPLFGRAPETFFEPDAPLSFPSDIWTMGTAIWEILGMKFPFSQHVPVDELVAEHIDVLGYETFPDRWRKAWNDQRRMGDQTYRASRRDIQMTNGHSRSCLGGVQSEISEEARSHRRLWRGREQGCS